MKAVIVLLCGGLVVLSGGASAQTSANSKPAVKIGVDTPVTKPVGGKSSFTSRQARTRMETRGYDVLSNPIKDDKGIWYAEGKKADGQSVQVMLDYQGNVFESGEYKGHPSSAPGINPTLPNPVKKGPPPGSGQ